MKTIGIFTSPQGHESIANAIGEKILRDADDRYQIKVFFHKQLWEKVYKSFYRIAPNALGGPWHMSTKIMDEVDQADKAVRQYFKLHIKKKIYEFMEENKIDLAINTYFVNNPALVDYQEEFGVPFFNIATDPRTIHTMVFSKQAKHNFIFDENINKSYLKKYPTTVSGWFVQKRFEEKYNQETVKKELKIKKGTNFLIASGSDGSSMVLKMLPTIINSPKEANFFIACGSNDSLYKNVVGIKRSIEKLSDSKAKIIPLSFTKDIHKYMQISDMVIGKAGPNTIFESVATETPFFAITHVHGQEDGNLDIIKEHHLGIVEENSKKANQKLMEIIENPEIIDSFKKNVKKMKEYNQKSINILLDEIDEEFSKN